MIPGAHQAARWRRPAPRRTWSAPLAQRMVQTAFPGCRLLDMEWLGGKLPQDWRQLARLFDLSALCEALTRDQLPDDVTAELVELVSATVENRDPRVGDKRPY